jgi:hypothetical protein
MSAAPKTGMLPLHHPTLQFTFTQYGSLRVFTPVFPAQSGHKKSRLSFEQPAFHFATITPLNNI